MSQVGIRIRYYAVGKILQALIAAAIAKNPIVVTTVVFTGILVLRICKLTKSASACIMKGKEGQRRQEDYESLSVFGR